MRVRKTRRIVAGALVLAVSLGTLSTGATAVAERPGGHADTQTIVDDIVENGAPGAMVFARDRRGAWTVTSGTGRLGAHDPIRPWDRARVASNTKMFVATVVVQLVAEGKIHLDDPIERHLPGLLQGNGYDGEKVTVRQLLQHTSGVADYVQDILADPDGADHPWKPEELVALGLSHPPTFEPGTGWSYSNTGYIVLGMLIEKVTGNDPGEEITDRIIRPYRLWQTTYPEPGDRRIRGPHVHGYFAFPGGPLRDFADFEPSITGAAGNMISTGPDLTRFVRALVAGKVVPPTLLKEMQHTVPAQGGDYGLGLREYNLPCGDVAWGHGGNMPGYDTFTAATKDGRSAFAIANGHLTNGNVADLRKAVESALC